MYSIRVNLIGCDDRILPGPARDTLEHWAIIEGSFPNVLAVQKNVLETEGDMRMFVMHVASAEDVAELKRLNTSFPRYPILAIVDATADQTLVLKSMRAGALQVVHPPVCPHDLQEALDCISTKFDDLSTLAQVITVTGSVGGCGTTAMAINLAHELAAQTKQRCILMELALRKGSLANNLDITPRYTTTDLISEIHRVDSRILQGALTEVTENLFALVGPYETIQTDCGNVDAAMQLVQLARHLASWLVLDVPSTYDDAFFRSLQVADKIVLVTDQTVAGLRGAQMICDSLENRRPVVVVNRYNAKTGGLSEDRIRRFLPDCELAMIGRDPAVVESQNCGQPLRVHSKRSPVLDDIEALVRKLTPDATAAKGETANQSIFNRLGRALSLS
jgi:pilus assembly protein CpaE